MSRVPGSIAYRQPVPRDGANRTRIRSTELEGFGAGTAFSTDMFGAASYPSRAIQLLSALAGFGIAIGASRSVDAQSFNRAATVALQPFSLDAVPVPALKTVRVAERADPDEQIQVAFFAPRVRPARPPREPHGQPVEQIDRSDDGREAEQAPSGFQNDRDHPIVAGSEAVVRNGIAYAPSRAPATVQRAIWAVNTLRHKPYVWGGGHGSFNDYGYDCSGSVSFALHYAGLLGTPMPTRDFLRYGERGRGRWITVYSRAGHTFAVIAGLRLDTTDLRYGGDVGPRWYADGRDTRGFDARHPSGF